MISFGKKLTSLNRFFVSDYFRADRVKRFKPRGISLNRFFVSDYFRAAQSPSVWGDAVQ